jgi:hypothetical protein
MPHKLDNLTSYFETSRRLNQATASLRDAASMLTKARKANASTDSHATQAVLNRLTTECERLLKRCESLTCSIKND